MFVVSFCLHTDLLYTPVLQNERIKCVLVFGFDLGYAFLRSCLRKRTRVGVGADRVHFADNITFMRASYHGELSKA